MNSIRVDISGVFTARHYYLGSVFPDDTCAPLLVPFRLIHVRFDSITILNITSYFPQQLCRVRFFFLSAPLVATALCSTVVATSGMTNSSLSKLSTDIFFYENLSNSLIRSAGAFVLGKTKMRKEPH